MSSKAMSRDQYSPPLSGSLPISLRLVRPSTRIPSPSSTLVSQKSPAVAQVVQKPPVKIDAHKIP